MAKSKNAWKKQVKIEQNYICPVCGKEGNNKSMNIHHIRNKCKGGGNERSNVVALHRTCHRWVHETYGNNKYDPRN